MGRLDTVREGIPVTSQFCSGLAPGAVPAMPVALAVLKPVAKDFLRRLPLPQPFADQTLERRPQSFCRSPAVLQSCLASQRALSTVRRLHGCNQRLSSHHVEASTEDAMGYLYLSASRHFSK